MSSKKASDNVASVDAPEPTTPGATIAVDPADMPTAADAADDIGRRLDSLITAQSFIDQQSILARILGKPRGYRFAVGRIAGFAIKVEERDSSLPPKNGKAPPPSIWINGHFESESLIDGELRTAAWLILPSSAGAMLKSAFDTGADRIILDLEIGVEATGRGIPYAWTVVAYGTRQSELQRVVADVRRRQLARSAQKAIGSPVNQAVQAEEPGEREAS